MAIKDLQLTEEQQREKLQELICIMNNMRWAQKYWHVHFGSAARLQAKRWESRADVFLNELGLTEHNNIKAVQITRK